MKRQREITRSYEVLKQINGKGENALFVGKAIKQATRATRKKEGNENDLRSGYGDFSRVAWKKFTVRLSRSRNFLSRIRETDIFRRAISKVIGIPFGNWGTLVK